MLAELYTQALLVDEELAYFTTGAMHFFVAPLIDEDLPFYMYFESMSQFLTTYTCHGAGTKPVL